MRHLRIALRLFALWVLLPWLGLMTDPHSYWLGELWAFFWLLAGPLAIILCWDCQPCTRRFRNLGLYLHFCCRSDA
jgi:hypothetical protein